MSLHAGLTNVRWQKLTLPEQLGNIGSEVGRVFKARSLEDKTAATNRALELFDLTLADSRWYGRGSEVARSREVFCSIAMGDKQFGNDTDSLEKYFMNFALLARRNR